MRSSNPTTGLAQGGLLGQLTRFVGPFMLGMLLQNLYGTADLFVVGNFATTADVSAVTVGSQVMTMITQTIIGFATGVTVLVGLYYGEGNKRKQAQSVGAAIPLFAAIAVAFTVLVVSLHRPIVAVLQTPVEAVLKTHQYLIVCAFGIVFIFGYNLIASILMGMGNTRTPFIFVAVACVINIALDIVLVSGFGMGALGAGIATTVAQAGSMVFGLFYIRRKKLGFTLTRADIRPSKWYSLKILKIGGPVALQNALVSVSFLFITAIINQLGLSFSAAVGIVEKIISFLFIPNFSFCSAVAAISAQNFGAGQPRRARRCMWLGGVAAFALSACFVVFCQLLPAFLPGLFTPDAEVVGLASQYLRSYVLDCIAVSFVFAMNGYFNSCERSWFTLLHSLVATFAVRIPLSYLFVNLPGSSLFVVGWAAPISSLVSLALCFIFLFYLDHRKNVKKGDLLRLGRD